ncbi:SigE family RNA polymerase sigma factor [Catenulispora sp. NL8]|uniref:SigE family RNA polymerase sigma factor n=1 Tax=Catenulispora pinistramenti TaxID=2705254 RepID=A0ABS5L120_9ACTN|nr:SigE family RNA polymerase sigma factor [Catenulispora pinistramenti]MBS2551959.1 SigE family RNA polymerase sigma factor [Catenulispora pinistramenti]
MDGLDDFTTFAHAQQGRLRRLAFLLCGDWNDAQDLAQTTLLNLCLHWNRARRADAIDAYAHKALIHAYLSDRKKYQRDRARATDFSVRAERDFATGPPELPELRLALLSALDKLAPRGRAVLVLRFWEDLSVEATAAALGCSTGNVKSQTSRALARLREILGDSLLDADDLTPIRPARPAAQNG